MGYGSGSGWNLIIVITITYFKFKSLVFQNQRPLIRVFVPRQHYQLHTKKCSSQTPIKLRPRPQTRLKIKAIRLKKSI